MSSVQPRPARRLPNAAQYAAFAKRTKAAAIPTVIVTPSPPSPSTSATTPTLSPGGSSPTSSGALTPRTPNDGAAASAINGKLDMPELVEALREVQQNQDDPLADYDKEIAAFLAQHPRHLYQHILDNTELTTLGKSAALSKLAFELTGLKSTLKRMRIQNTDKFEMRCVVPEMVWEEKKYHWLESTSRVGNFVKNTPREVYAHIVDERSLSDCQKLERLSLLMVEEEILTKYSALREYLATVPLEDYVHILRDRSMTVDDRAHALCKFGVWRERE